MHEALTGRQSAPQDEENLFVLATGQASQAADGKTPTIRTGLAASGPKLSSSSVALAAVTVAVAVAVAVAECSVSQSQSQSQSQ